MDARCFSDENRRSWTTALLTLALLLVFNVSCALELAFVSHKKADSVSRLAANTAELANAQATVVLTSSPRFEDRVQQADVVVLVGQQALTARDRIPANIPTLAVLIPAQQVPALALQSAIYLEPPFSRQIALAQALIGDDQPLGVLATNQQSLLTLCDCEDSLDSKRLQAYYLDDYDSLNRALVDLLQSSQALIGIYDTTLYSAANIKNILITAYRQSRPLIGPSSAYIRAGALASTYSDLGDTARRLAELVTAGQQGDWPAAGYNPYFKVRYNEQVARSLNLILPDAEQLAETLRQQEQP